MSGFRAAAALAVLFGLAIGGGAAAAQTREAAAGNADLAPVPEPDVSAFESEVQALLADTLERLADLPGDELAPPERALVFGEAGQVFQAHGLDEQALACYRNAERLAGSSDPRWPYLAGYVHQSLGRFDQAKDDYRRVLAATPDDPLARFRIAEILRVTGEHAVAREVFSGLLDRPGLQAASAAGLGAIELELGDVRAAAAHLERALELQPDADQLHFPLAAAYRRLGRVDEAERHAELAGTGKPTPLDPRLREVSVRSVSSESYLLLGLQKVQAEAFDQAAAAYEQAARLNPENKRAYLNLAVTEMKLGRDDSAERNLRRALELDADYPHAHLNLAILLEERGDLAVAEEHYRRALAGDPDGVETNFRAAGLAMQRRDYGAAVGRYRKVVRRAPALIQARYLGALALLALDRRQEAKEALAEAVELAPERPDLRLALTRSIATGPPLSAEEMERALSLARELYEERRSAEDAETLAMALAAAGRFDEAARLQEQVLAAAAGGDPGVLAHLRQNLDRYRAGERADRPFP